MWQGYPFWADSAAPTTPTIYDPILMTAITTLTFRGTSRKQRLMGISVAAGTPTLNNSVRVRVGNSLPDYRRISIPAVAMDHNNPISHQDFMTNYFDLGGLEVLEGETIELSCQGLDGAAGTGAFAGVLWVDDMEPESPPIPQGNIICLRHGLDGTAADAGATLTNISAGLDTKDLENNRLYTPFMTISYCEDQLVEAIFFKAGKDVMTVPQCGRMIYPRAPIQFTGLEYNSGAIAMWGQCAAAAGIHVYMYCIESAISGGPQPVNAPTVQQVTSQPISGAVSVQPLLGGGGSLRPSLGGGLFQRRQ